MPKNINAASRLYRAIVNASAMPENTTSLAVWGNVFNVEGQDDTRKALAITDRLGWLHRELEITRQQMQGSGFPEEHYMPALNRVEQAISPLLLSTTWNNGKQYLTADSIGALGFCVDLLPDEETQIKPEELEEVRRGIVELAESLESSALPEGLKTLIFHHIELMRAALDQYPIAGAKAIREVVRTARGEILEQGAAVNDNLESKEFRKLSSLWIKLNQVADIAMKAEKAGQIGEKVIHFLQNLL